MPRFTLRNFTIFAIIVATIIYVTNDSNDIPLQQYALYLMAIGCSPISYFFVRRFEGTGPLLALAGNVVFMYMFPIIGFYISNFPVRIITQLVITILPWLFLYKRCKCLEKELYENDLH